MKTLVTQPPCNGNPDSNNNIDSGNGSSSAAAASRKWKHDYKEELQAVTKITIDISNNGQRLTFPEIQAKNTSFNETFCKAWLEKFPLHRDTLVQNTYTYR